MHHRRSGWSGLVPVGVLVVAATACYTSQPTSTSDFTTVTTVYDTGAAFGTFKTYALVDSVVHLDTVGQVDNIPRTYDQTILNTVNQNMQSLGYTQKATATGADLVAIVAATTITATGFVSYPYYPYYGWWGGWGGAYAGWGYYYPGYTVPYSYTTGTLLVGLINNRNADSALKLLPLIWTGAANALLTGNSAAAATNIPVRINQMFTQSPYLKAAP